MHAFLHDMQSAARTLRRAPGFVIVAVATLAVAIAVNAAMFTFLNGVFFRPLPYASPEQLRGVRVGPAEQGPFEPPSVRELRDALAAFGPVAAYVERAFVVSTQASGADDAPGIVQGSEVDANVATVVGVAPVLGRSFDAGDVTAGAPPTAVLGAAFWRSRLNARPDILGETLRIDGVDHVIIGILPDRFAFPDFAQFWVPLMDADVTLSEASVLFRLRESHTDEAGIAAVEQRFDVAGTPVRVRFNDIVPNGGALLAAILGAIGFVLLIACSNVANLVLVRGTARRHELGVRTALGASRLALLRYLSLEGGWIALLAAALGTIASGWLTDLLIAAVPVDQLPVWFEPRIDGLVLAYITALAALAVIISATLPAFTVTRGALATTLNETGARSAGDAAAGRTRSALVAVQIALATVLLAGAGLLLRAFGAQRAVDPGYAADAILEVPTLRPPPAMGTVDVFADDARARIAALAGIEAAAVAAPVTVPGRAVSPADAARALSSLPEAVSPGYFATLGLTLLQGRTFTAGDETGAVVVSALVARTLFESVDAAHGATFRFENDAPARVRTVVGVVADRKAAIGGTMDGAAPLPHVYVPFIEGDPRAVRVLARVEAGDPLRIAPSVMEILRELDRDAVLRAPRVLGDIERLQTGDLRWFATIFAGFGGVALALAALGCWGVVAYTVTRRRREIGVRMTLGATGSRVVREIVAGIVPPLAAGLGIGLLGALAMGRLLRGLLFGVQPMDPVTLGAVLLMFASIAGLSAWLPARRAARIDPLQALRAD